MKNKLDENIKENIIFGSFYAICIAIIILLSVGIANAGTFVFHTNGKITGRAKSCGKACSSRPDALRIDEATYNSITRFHIVVNDKVVELKQAEKDVILQAESDAQEQSQIASINELEITQKEAWVAWLKLYNAKVPLQYRVTPLELKNQVLKDKGYTP